MVRELLISVSRHISPQPIPYVRPDLVVVCVLAGELFGVSWLALMVAVSWNVLVSVRNWLAMLDID